jgi:hypothetical protein
MEDVFNLLYRLPGLNYQDILGMPSKESAWLIRRLIKQKEKESKRYG